MVNPNDTFRIKGRIGLSGITGLPFWKVIVRTHPSQTFVGHSTVRVECPGQRVQQRVDGRIQA